MAANSPRGPQPATAKTKLVHMLDGAQLDVEVGYTVAGSHIQWSASLSHNGKALGVVIDGGAFVLLKSGSHFDIGCGIAAAARQRLRIMGPELRAKMRASCAAGNGAAPRELAWPPARPKG